MPNVAVEDSRVGEIPITPEPSENLADCLLHLEHHAFKPECWDVLISFYLTMKGRFPRECSDQILKRYQLKYESDLLKEIHVRVVS